MSTSWICGACGTTNVGRASCEACATSSPAATPHALAATALRDAAATHEAQVDESARGNHELAAYLGTVVDAHLDDARVMQGFDGR